MLIADICFGFAGRYIQVHAKGGATARNEYICKQMNAEVVLFGSSRCSHHYVPSIIEDSLHMSCYNAGNDGNGIIFLYAKWKMLVSRYKPKMIIYDVNEDYDLFAGDNTQFLGDMRIYYDMPGVDSVMWSVDEKEKYKMKSMMYRYNSIWLQMLSDNLHPLSSNKSGYVEIERRMTYEPGEHKYPEIVNYDTLKIYYLEKLIQECKMKGIKLLFFLSPMYKAKKIDLFIPLFHICKKYGVPIINHYTDTQFNENHNYFYDSVHMNRYGAEKYTKCIVSEIKKNRYL